MLEVSVPCERCHAPVRFGQSTCARCGAKPSRDAKAALHARLAASSDDYRVLQDHISAGRTALLVATLVYVVLGAIAFLGTAGESFSAEQDAAIFASVLIDELIAAAFLVLWWLARDRPAMALISAAVLWIAFQALLLVVYPLAFSSGLLGKGLVAILMIRGIVAAIRARAFIRKLR